MSDHASSSEPNAPGNHRASTRSASRSHVASVPRASTSTCPPVDVIASIRDHCDVRPTFSTASAGQ